MDVIAKNLGMEFHDGERVVEVFKGVDATIKSGEAVAVVGESGVGKTTLLYVLGGLERPTSGEVVLGTFPLTETQKRGEDIASFRGKHLGFVFQFHNLLPEFDAVENVAMPLLLRGENPKVATDRARELLDRVGLSHRLTHRPGALSGGEQQRVAIARALVAKPGLILADEPTGNLDVRTAGQVSDVLLKLRQEEGTTLIIVTHSRELAARTGRILELSLNGLRQT